MRVMKLALHVLPFPTAPACLLGAVCGALRCTTRKEKATPSPKRAGDAPGCDQSAKLGCSTPIRRTGEGWCGGPCDLHNGSGFRHGQVRVCPRSREQGLCKSLDPGGPSKRMALVGVWIGRLWLVALGLVVSRCGWQQVQSWCRLRLPPGPFLASPPYIRVARSSSSGRYAGPIPRRRPQGTVPWHASDRMRAAFPCSRLLVPLYAVPPEGPYPGIPLGSSAWRDSRYQGGRWGPYHCGMCSLRDPESHDRLMAEMARGYGGRGTEGGGGGGHDPGTVCAGRHGHGDEPRVHGAEHRDVWRGCPLVPASTLLRGRCRQTPREGGHG